MATKAVKRRSHTSLVVNPAPRGLSIARRSSVKTSQARKTNPVRTAAATNPRRRRRRRNPGGLQSVMTNPGSGALLGALFAGAGLSLIDLGLSRVAPSASPVIQIGLKVAVAFGIQTFGGRVPVFGKYKDGIAFLLLGLAGKQAFDYWALPTVRSTFSSVTGQFNNLLSPPVAAPAANGGTMAGVRRYAGVY